MMNYKVIVIIPAKGNSNRLHNKNIFPFRGKPMIAWAIEACKESKHNIDVVVNSDSKKILEISKNYGAKTIMRNSGACGDNIYKQEVIRSSIIEIEKCYGKYDIVISLQPNSPEIRGSHLDLAIDTLIREGKDEIFSVNKNLMQNGAFRVMRWNYVFQKDLSTNCGVIICELKDIHTEEDIKEIE